MQEAMRSGLAKAMGVAIGALLVAVATLILDLKEERDETRAVREVWLGRITQNKSDIRDIWIEMARRRDVFEQHLADHIREK